MGIHKRGNRTINSILSDDIRMLIYGAIQGTLINDLSHIGEYTNQNNYFLNTDLITLDDNIKIVSHRKMRLHIGDSVITLNCYYAPSVPCAIISES